MTHVCLSGFVSLGFITVEIHLKHFTKCLQLLTAIMQVQLLCCDYVRMMNTI